MKSEFYIIFEYGTWRLEERQEGGYTSTLVSASSFSDLMQQINYGPLSGRKVIIPLVVL